MVDELWSTLPSNSGFRPRIAFGPTAGSLPHITTGTGALIIVVVVVGRQDCIGAVLVEIFLGCLLESRLVSSERGARLTYTRRLHHDMLLTYYTLVINSHVHCTAWRCAITTQLLAREFAAPMEDGGRPTIVI